MGRRTRATVALQRIVLRSGSTFLRPLWKLLYRAAARAGAAFLTWGERGASAYVRGGVEGPDFVPGLTDVDLTIVLAQDRAGRSAAVGRVRSRRDRMRRVLPLASLLLDWPAVHEERQLGELAGSSALTHGLGRSDQPAEARAAYLGEEASLDGILMLERPGLTAPTEHWHLLRGPGFRPPQHQSSREPGRQLNAAWLELVFWWRQLFAACATPAGPRAADLCVKCIAEPARIWLLLAHGELSRGRAEVLRRAIELMPEEAEVLREALELQAALPRSPEPPLAEMLPGMVRISARIAARIEGDAEAAGWTKVRLAGAEPASPILSEGGWRPPGPLAADADAEVLPLTDWRSLACPRAPDDSFALLSADVREPATLVAAASMRRGPYPTMRAEGMLIRPGATYPRTRLRAIQCRATDPVSFSLVDRTPWAAFPNLPGWSALDAAERAVAEHRAWLRSSEWTDGNGSPPDPGRALGLTLTGARAALFLESVVGADPVLAVTVAETGRLLAARSASVRSIAEEAVGRYREFALHGRQPPPDVVTALRELALGLAPYAGGY